MKALRKALLVSVALVGLWACSGGAVVHRHRPAPRPSVHAVWVPGYWAHHGHNSVWIAGYWRYR
jgi:hypothetical protein